MMNSAMDRWANESSSMYQDHIRDIDEKENTTERKASDSAKDDFRKNRKPLGQKQQEQEVIKSLDELYKPIRVPRKKKKSPDLNKSYTSSSSGNKAIRRRSIPVLELLGSTDDDKSKDNLPPLVVHSVEEMNEVSTIAGDTFVGVEMDADVAEAVPPSPYGSTYGEHPIPVPPGASMDNGMITPTYSVLHNTKKTFSRIFSPEMSLRGADSESTMPESPENNDSEFEHVEKGTSKSFRSSQKKKRPNADKSFSTTDPNNFDDEEKSFLHSEKMSPRRRQLRCIMCSACFLAVFLLVGIAALAYTLYVIRHQDQGALSLFSRDFWDRLAFWKNDNEATVDFYEGTWAPTSTSTWWSSTDTSTLAPTDGSSEISLPRAMNKIRSIVVYDVLDKKLNGINTAALNDPSSMQYSVMQWLASDPSFGSYSDEKILQRYALGCFYQGLLGEETRNATNTLDAKNFDIVRENWMGASDECEWAYTETKPDQYSCNEEGQIRSIHLEDAGFTGTLSPEIAFLSDSLQSLFLTSNEIQGTIPTAFGQLTTLKRLQLSRNSLEGTVNGPNFLAPLEKLEIIGLGGNKFSGPIPEELGTMPRMIYINIPYNDFTGSIPSSWNTTRLNHVNLAFNELNGTIPQELTGIETLNNLFLVGNDLEGDVTSSVCIGDFDNATTYNGMKMSVDCASVHCACCGCDGVTPAPVAFEAEVPEGELQTAELDGQTFPFVSDESFDVAMEVLNGALPANKASERYDCQTIDVGFSCYTSGWSIDFEMSTSNCGTRQTSPPTTTDYDLVALYPFEGDVDGPSTVGTLKSLQDSLFWATACGLEDCDGVIANGQMYYRNTYPTLTAPLSPPWWPIAPDSMMQVQWIRVDASGAAIVLAESEPFEVSDRC